MLYDYDDAVRRLKEAAAAARKPVLRTFINNICMKTSYLTPTHSITHSHLLYCCSVENYFCRIMIIVHTECKTSHINTELNVVVFI